MLAVSAAALTGCSSSSGGGGGDGAFRGDDPDPVPDVSNARFSFNIDPNFVQENDSGFVDFIDSVFSGALEPINRIDNIFGGTTVPVTYGNCGSPNASYNPGRRSITICHELIDVMFSEFIASDTSGDSEDDVLDRAFGRAFSAAGFVVHHEAGHALDDLVNVGTGGNFESVADTIGTVLSVQTGLSSGPIFAGLFFSNASSDAGSAGIHGNGTDRAFDLICWATGSSSRLAAAVQPITDILIRSGRDCVGEYFDGRQFVQGLIPDIQQIPPAASLRLADRKISSLRAAMQSMSAKPDPILMSSNQGK